MTGKKETEKGSRNDGRVATRRGFGTVIGAGALIVAGCGGGDDNGTSAPPPTPPPAPAPAPAPPPPPASPPQITVQPTAQVVAQAGQTARFTVQVSGDSPRFQWKRNGIDIPGATASVYEFVTAAADDGVQFSVAVSSAGGTVVSSPVALTVGLSFDLLAAFRSFLSAVRTLKGTGPAGEYLYQQYSGGTSTVGGIPVHAYTIFSRAEPNTDPYGVYYKFYNFNADEKLVATYHFRGPFLGAGDADAYSLIDSPQPLPQAARVGDSGLWYVARNYYSATINPPAVTTGTTTAIYSVEADSNTTVLLRLKETIVTLPQLGGQVPTDPKTTVREMVLRIGSAGDVKLVSDSTVISDVKVLFGDA